MQLLSDSIERPVQAFQRPVARFAVDAIRKHRTEFEWGVGFLCDHGPSQARSSSLFMIGIQSRNASMDLSLSGDCLSNLRLLYTGIDLSL